MTSEKELRKLLEELRMRRTNTKFRLIETLVKMGEGWHLWKEIKEAAEKDGIVGEHLFDNLIELCRISDFLESDYKEKRASKLTSFRITKLALLKKALQS